MLSIFKGYWQRKFLECERERRRLEADARCHRGLYDNAEEEVSKLRDNNYLQSVAIDKLSNENVKLSGEVDKLKAELDRLRHENALQTELIRTMRMNARLWESGKAAFIDGEEVREWTPSAKSASI